MSYLSDKETTAFIFKILDIYKSDKYIEVVNPLALDKTGRGFF